MKTRRPLTWPLNCFAKAAGVPMSFNKYFLQFKSNLTATALTALIVLSMGCSQSGQFSTEGKQIIDPLTGNGDSNSITGISGQPVDPPVPVALAYKMQTLAWETSTNPERTAWSQYLQDLILNKWNTLLAGADDIETFCPQYHNLNNNERANVWAALFVGVTKYESNYNPMSRYNETTMGTDPITRQPVYSEGLLQLSYQDIQGFSFCEFDWSLDKNLKATDPKKTILDPYKNLYCGVGIMARQVAKKGIITVSSGAYWSTLKSGGRYQHISGIAGIVKKLNFCN
jgi:hypothetical protein